MNEPENTAMAAGTAPQITYTNPTMERRVEGWPFGRRERATALFSIEQHPTRGERAVRVIVDPLTGRQFAPKKLTYAHKVRIVDGSNGRTYIAELTRSGFVSIMCGDMKYQHETIHEGNPRFGEVRALFEGPQSRTVDARFVDVIKKHGFPKDPGKGGCGPQGWTHVEGGTNE
jgi:hypothetical protein